MSAIDDLPMIGALARRIEEARVLYHRHTADVPGRVRAVVDEMNTMAEQVEQYSGLQLVDKDVLDVGPGQLHGFMHWLAARNRAVGIDLDVSPQGVAPAEYLRLLKENGPQRFVKTVARKMVGADRRFRAELAEQLGLESLPRLDIRQMDATKMTFADESFDFVFSRSVFEHIDDPAAAAREVARVLRPGGAVFLIVHLYTADSGCHDPRIMFGDRAGLPFWAHLRPETAAAVRPNSYLNRVRLSEWREIFRDCMPGCKLTDIAETDPAAALALAEARSASELADYSDEELLTVVQQVQWTKPLAPD